MLLTNGILKLNHCKLYMLLHTWFWTSLFKILFVWMFSYHQGGFLHGHNVKIISILQITPFSNTTIMPLYLLECHGVYTQLYSELYSFSVFCSQFNTFLDVDQPPFHPNFSILGYACPS